MTKNELMEMALRSGLMHRSLRDGYASLIDGMPVELMSFANAILERAAVECEKQIEREKYGHAAHAVLMAQENIRSLKLPTN